MSEAPQDAVADLDQSELSEQLRDLVARFDEFRGRL